MEDVRTPEQELTTAELVRHAVAEAKLLARAEVELAKAELRQEVREVKQAGIAYGVALTLALCGLSLLFVALAMVLPMGAGLSALVVGLALLAAASFAAWIGLRHTPKRPMERTRRRILDDVLLTKERFA